MGHRAVWSSYWRDSREEDSLANLLTALPALSHISRLCLGLALLCATLASACRGKSGPLQGSENAQIEALRFPHNRHTLLSCTYCHPSEGAQASTTLRPGQNQHKSCSESECHAAEFRGAPTEFCALCHEEVGTGEGDTSPLVPFPPQDTRRSQVVAFSHQLHLDASAMEQRLGFHISCVDCHFLDAGSQDEQELRRPDHKACARCHAAESAPDDTPSMDSCKGCHQDSQQRAVVDSRMIEGDLQFSHRRHRSDRRGELISCATCHLESVSASEEQVGQHATPKMRICVDCHDDPERVNTKHRMRRCQTCHITRSAGLGSIAPRSHLPATERPADHTQAFRRDHASDARAESQNCARCHTMLSGNKRDTCDECHQVMRPRDHVVTWREYDHGPEAGGLSERCTTCHQVDFCVACHQKPPRSHFPRMAFLAGGHGTQAVLNMRACMTCHQPDRGSGSSSCNRSGCHRSEPR